jgi:hypothetical protein
MNSFKLNLNLYLVAILLVLFSCSGDENETNPEDILLKSVIKRTIDSEFETFYTYEGKKLVKTKSNRVLVKLIYVDERLKEIRYSIYPEQEDYTNLIYEFTYNSENRLIKMKDYDLGREITFTYTSETVINYYTTILNPLPGETDIYGSIILEDNEIQQTTNSINNLTFYYHYDDKNNPLKNITGFDELRLISHFCGSYTSAGIPIFPNRGIYHNDLYYTTSNGYQSPSKIYLYNSKGFPTSINNDEYKLYYN